MMLKCFCILICIAVFKLCLCQRIASENESVLGKKYLVYFVKSPYSKADDDTWICAGALVSPTQILTAATCLVEMERIYAIAGYRKYVHGRDVDKNACTRKYKQRVVSIAIPKEYKLSADEPVERINVDIGIATVETPYNFSDETFRVYCSYEPQTILINFHKTNQENKTRALALGWAGIAARSNSNSPPKDSESQSFHKATTVIVDKKYCQSFAIHDDLKKVLDEYLLCASGNGNLDPENAETELEIIEVCPIGRRKGANNSCLDEDFNFRRKVTNISETFKGKKYENDTIQSEINITNSRRSPLSELCLNNHGGPLITWVGLKEMVIGVALSDIPSQNYECFGPRLYVSTAETGKIIKCLLETNTTKRNICNDQLDDKRYEVNKIDIKWPDVANKQSELNPYKISAFLRQGNEEEPLQVRPTRDLGQVEVGKPQLSESNKEVNDPQNNQNQYQDMQPSDEQLQQERYDSQVYQHVYEQPRQNITVHSYIPPHEEYGPPQVHSYYQPHINLYNPLQMDSLNQRQVESQNQQQVDSLNRQQKESQNQPQVNSFSQTQMESYNQPQVDSYNRAPIGSQNNQQIGLYNQPRMGSYNQPPIRTDNEPQVQFYNQPPVASYHQPQLGLHNQPPADSYIQPNVETLKQLLVESDNQPQTVLNNQPPVELLNQPIVQLYNDPPVDDKPQNQVSQNQPQGQMNNQPPIDPYKQPQVDAYKQTQKESYTHPQAETYNQPEKKSFSQPQKYQFKLPRIDLYKETETQSYNQPQIESGPELYKKSEAQTQTQSAYNDPRIGSFNLPTVEYDPLDILSQNTERTEVDSFKLPIIEPYGQPSPVESFKQPVIEPYIPQLEPIEPQVQQYVQPFQQHRFQTFDQQPDQLASQPLDTSQVLNILRERMHESTIDATTTEPQIFDQIYSLLHLPTIEIPPSPPPEETFEEMFRSLHDISLDRPHDQEFESRDKIAPFEQRFQHTFDQQLEKTFGKPYEKPYEEQIGQAFNKQNGKKFKQTYDGMSMLPNKLKLQELKLQQNYKNELDEVEVRPQQPLDYQDYLIYNRRNENT